ncbi:dihydrodipicolinate synthase family protein [Paracoccus onubensis]|uniref:dihydrodipicolinate synthase family protein n=1 Tax=Paracoccus onubensis TaxID=1675788 RepID=UPI002731D090|nr:dihydrodipicolinate synthase family protein [Paracoccus onubensis]MDP0926100.1 dihydrodipicolinate synthase family protein [Paracoccus onubensis]
MGLHHSNLPQDVLAILRKGAVIPAHPLALDANRKFDPVRQRALSRYYVDAGSGGLAVGVHTTQFAIRDTGLYEPVLKAAANDAAGWTDRPLVMIAGVAGKTAQAVNEAVIAHDLGYHAVLVSMGAMRGASGDELITHCETVAREMPIIGFYMQTAVGGIDLDAAFWTRFAAIDNAVAIKVAPFNRYRTLDVMRGVVEARAEDRITLYTGNDDHIVADLATPFDIPRGNDMVRLRFRGGLLGHWSVWTRKAVELLDRIHAAIDAGKAMPAELMGLDARVTDCNAAFFDVANSFHGCIAGCHEVLRRQGLLEGIWCLDPEEGLSPGQAAEIDRIYAAHPDLADDDFVVANRERWLS